jgi:tripartite-type tricarboxylate transporter receptor subunit TctC
VSDVQVWAIDALIYKTLPFDPFKDFTPITILASAPNFLVMSSLLPVSNEFDKLIAFLKEHPRTYNYGTAGIGSIHHFTMELLKSKTGISVTHVPYKGGNQVLPALASGEIALGIQSLSQLPTFLRQGTVKAVAVATAKRSPALPEVPTLGELGVPEMDLPGSMGLLAPKGAPPDIVAKIAAAIRAATQDPVPQSKLTSLGVVPVGNTPQEMLEWMKSDAARYAKAAELAGLKPD